MHAQDFQEPKGDIIWTKHQANQEGTPRCATSKVIQIISKNQINTWLIAKFNTRTPQKPMSTQKTKTHMLKDLSHSRGKTNIKEWDNQLPKEKQGSNK